MDLIRRLRRNRCGALAFAAWPALAGATDYLVRDARLCDDSGQTCLRANLTWEHNARLLRLQGRIEHAAGPGRIVLRLSGTSRPGAARYTTLEVTVRGRYSEIVDARMVPDDPDVDDWRLDRVEFRPAEPPAR